jgi:glycolate oxidase
VSESILAQLRSRLGEGAVLAGVDAAARHHTDWSGAPHATPPVVLRPRDPAGVAAALGICHAAGQPLCVQGGLTGLAGGANPLAGEWVLSLEKLNAIEEIDAVGGTAIVQAGVPLQVLQEQVAGLGWFFPVDLGARGSCQMGGNAATNAGGIRVLRYGMMRESVLGLEVALADGRLLTMLNRVLKNNAGFDLKHLFIGSEGTLGVITKIWIRLTPDPQDYRTFRAIFDSVEDATNTASAIIAAGIIPAALELMDQGIMEAVEAAYHFGFPPDAAAVLIIEVDGPRVGLDAQESQIVAVCQSNHAREILQAKSAAERALLWKCRKMASGAMGRLSPSKMSEDCVVPRKHLPAMLEKIAKASRKHGVRIVCVAHAGDGNVHPFILFDERDKEQVKRVMAAGDDILADCLALGGSVTAEHGIGVEKIEFMPKQFGPDDLEAMRKVRSAFDPQWKFNPGKLILNDN